MSKLAIITTHPIQYYAPVFKALAKHHPQTKVFYTWGNDSIKKFDPDFKQTIEWDIPLLEGYNYEFLENSSSTPGSTHFRGIINPGAIRAIDKFDPDVILIYGWAWHSHLKILRHYTRKKKICFRGDSTLLDTPKGYKRFLRSLFLRWIYSYVDIAFYVGTQNKVYFQHFGLKESQLKFAPHAVDNTRFSVSKKVEANHLREQLNIPSNGIVILFAGKLEQKKDPLTLMDAFEHLVQENVFLLFAGNGVLESELKQRARRSSKAEKIRFLPFQNQSAMPALYQTCQVFCLASIGPGETWGLAVNEAMAAGRPVLVSDKTGCAVDLVKVGVNGYIFKAGDKEDLTDKLQTLVGSREQLERFGHASQTLIEKWSVDHQASLILDEINNIQCPE